MKKVKVVYSVAGEGRGHAGRAIGIYENLKDIMEPHFICGGKAYELLKPMGYSITEIPFLGFVYENDSINQFKTVVKNLKLYLNRKKVYKQIEEELNRVKPDFVMTDFEYFLPRVAKKMNIPVIQITHQHVLIACKYYVPFKLFFDFLKAYIVSGIIITNTAYSLGISFYQLPFKRKYKSKNLKLFLPLLRKDVVEAVPVEGKKILVYFSCETFSWVIELLKQIKTESFIVYGLKNEHHIDGNIEYKPISPTVFLDDLNVCKAVITNGGHTLVSEAIYLRKPVLAFYVKGQFEQFLNAYYLDELGYGRRIKSDKTALNEINEFLKIVPELSEKLKYVKICGNKDVVSYLRNIFLNHGKKKK